MRDFHSIIQTFSTNKTKQGIPKSLNSNKFKIRQFFPINSQCNKVNFVHTQQYKYDLKINENKGKIKNPSQ